MESRSFPELVGLLWEMDMLRPHLDELCRQKPAVGSFELQHEFTQASEHRVFRVWARTLITDGEQVVLVTIEDISAQKNTERLLERLNRELEMQIHSTEETLGRTQTELQALAASLFTSQEEERRRVALELHDDIIQKLALLQIELDQFQMNVPENPAKIRNTIANLSQATVRLTDQIRGISHRLHPSIIEDLGLPEALRGLIDDFRRSENMPATFIRHNVPESIPLEIAGVLYRIAQEGLRNVAKHAGKTHTKISLECVDSKLRLQIRDLGEGFDIQDVTHGLGLISMAERARLV